MDITQRTFGFEQTVLADSAKIIKVQRFNAPDAGIATTFIKAIAAHRHFSRDSDPPQ